jgi:hemolysin activation/secretion protein
LVYHVNNDATGATFDYSALQLSFSKYLNLGNNVLAINYNSVNIFGDAPFYELALFGGGKRSRGYIEGEYRANNSFAIQAEYRVRFKNKLKRFGAVIFASAGQIFDDFEELGFQNTRPAVGTGLRFLLSPEQNLNLRLDTGIGRNGLQFYLTFAEAF